MRPLRGIRLLVPAGVALAVVTLAACGGSGHPSAGATAAGTSTTAPATADPTSSPPTTRAPATSQPPRPTTARSPQPGWSVLTENPAGVVADTRTLTEADGARVTLVRWRAGTYRLGLHFGSEDPSSSGLAVPAAAGDTVSAAERPVLVGAFNGGFKTSTGSGGFEADGLTAVPLVAGDASTVISSAGSAAVGYWDRGVPAPGEKVTSVRQNLSTLLVDHGRAAANAADVPAWGATIGGVDVIARSALGTDPAGDLLYAGSMDALPGDMAAAMISGGATTAMELDINPYWVQCDTAAGPGQPLSATIPGQQRAADTYLSGWTRDFFTVTLR